MGNFQNVDREKYLMPLAAGLPRGLSGREGKGERLKVSKEFTHRHLGRLRDPHQGIDGDVLVPALDFANVLRIQIGALGQPFLGQFSVFAEMANRLGQNFAMLRGSIAHKNRG